ncbi:MAG TPA: TonB-dependent receptor [Phenylobacterium sp.]|jgi:outer membrane receptor protein involved in Fe transport|nr:TonB-dependent receptor [Phenylobacterium sp.]
MAALNGTEARRYAVGGGARRNSEHRWWLAGASLAVLAVAPTARAADAATDNTPSVQEIVVTAEKREENVNKVPMSIVAATGAQLQALGIDQPRDLVKITPSFTYADSYVGSPIYTLRGVGFSDNSLGGRPTVSIYTDEAPIPFAIETRGADLDLERVEVLKGPQGTLFGQNATGGAINYIDAKPTDTFQAGAHASYGSYNAVDVGGFVSGPVADTLQARASIDHTQMDPWQRSYTTGARTGAGDFTSGRVILAWTPDANLKVQLNLNGYVEGSELQAGQLIGVSPSIPAAGALIPALSNYPLAPHSATAANFDPGANYHRNNHFGQANLRVDYSLPHDLTLTSITSYSGYSERQLQDLDGTALANLNQFTRGEISSWSEEARIAGPLMDRGHFVVGFNYADDRVLESNFLQIPYSTPAFTFVPFGLPLYTAFRDMDNQHATTVAGFGSADYDVTDAVKIYGGVRYTQSNDAFNGCTGDNGNGVAAEDFGFLYNLSRAAVGLPANPPIAPGGCITAAPGLVPGLVRSTLDQNNVSWRVGAQWTLTEGMLVYANVSKGYKAGGYPDLAASAASQFAPTLQESVLAYEAGFKATLLDRTLQLNGAGFYYDYADKQILGRVLDPVFGPLLKLVNVPHSSITGAELQLDWTPIRGLDVSAGGSYIHSEILDHFTNYDPNGALTDFNGEAFPNTPKWQLDSSIGYHWGLNDRLDGFVGGNVTYQSATNSQLGDLPLLKIDAYALLDLRAGVETRDGAWRLSVFGRNVTNAYYWTAANHDLDTTVRFAGMPATWGVRLDYRLK